MRATVERAFAEGGSFAFDHRAVHDEGTVRWLHGRRVGRSATVGAVVRMVGTAQDITERRRIDESATRSSPPSRTSSARR